MKTDHVLDPKVSYKKSYRPCHQSTIQSSYKSIKGKFLKANYKNQPSTVPFTCIIYCTCNTCILLLDNVGP